MPWGLQSASRHALGTAGVSDAARADVKARVRKEAKRVAKASASTTLLMASASPSDAIMALCENVSAAMARMRPSMASRSRTAHSVSGLTYSVSATPWSRRVSIAAVMAACWRGASDSCVSTLNERSESISSPKKSMRRGISSA